jgi:hypothetical protein
MIVRKIGAHEPDQTRGDQQGGDRGATSVAGTAAAAIDPRLKPGRSILRWSG